MNKPIFSEPFRSKFVDDLGQPWKISWFCMDHIGLKDNPRKKATGIGTIHRYYSELIDEHPDFGDEIQFHFHPLPIGGNELAAATSYGLNMPSILQALAERLLEFNWFPTCYRPGFHSVRPDSHLFLEQWFPFDYSNQSHEEESSQPDLADGRFGDWREAPTTWGGFNPSLVNHQKPGELRRTTYRCLNMGTRHRLMNKQHVEQAFDEASDNGKAVLAFTDHDFRDISKDVDQVREWIEEVRRSNPNVKVEFSTASEAARQCSDLPSEAPPLQVTMSQNRLLVTTDPNSTFSHQPFLAIRHKDGRTFHDNFDRGLKAGTFSYIFDDLTLPMGEVDLLGVAVSGRNGMSSTALIAPA